MEGMFLLVLSLIADLMSLDTAARLLKAMVKTTLTGSWAG
jgi:hypothetical protein